MKIAAWKPAAAAAGLAFAALALTACGGAESRRTSHLQRGEKYFATGNLDKARVEFRNALQIDPNDAQARYMSGRVAEKQGDIRQAAGMYQSAIDANPQHVQARAQLGRVLVFAGAAKKALDIVAPGLEKHPDDPDLLTVRAAARAQLKDRAGALADAERALQIKPDSENAIALLAALYRQEGDPQRAIDLVDAALKRTPRSVDLRQLLADLRFSVGDPQAAERELRELVKLEPAEMRHRQRLAMFLMRIKRRDDALRVYEDAVRALPDSDQAKFAYVEFLVANRSPAEGEKALREFIARAPKDHELQNRLGALQQRANSLDEAVATYQKVIAADGDGVQGLVARNRIAAVRVMQRRYDDASRLLAEVLKKNPRDNEALLLRGGIALERRDAPGAIADFRAVLRDQPRSVGVLRALARAHIANGEPALAEENLKLALDAAPSVVATRVELAQLLAQTQRGEQAVTLLEETVNSAPADAAAREALVRAYLSAQNLDAARTAAEDLKTLRPDSATGHYLAGLIAQSQKRFDEAARGFERALELQPTAMDVLTALARLDLARGRSAEARARVAAVTVKNPKNAVAMNLLGELSLTSKDTAMAVEQFTRASQLAPKWWLPYRNLALAQLSTGQVAAGVAAYESGVKATGGVAELVADLASLYERQGRADDAIREYEALHKRSPQLELAANNLAMLLVTYRKDAASLDRARDLTQPFANTRNSALLDTHGWVRFKRGEYAQALPVLEQALGQSPDSRVIRYHLAMAQLQAGKRDEARANLQAALKDAKRGFAGIDDARTKLAELEKRSAG